MVNSISVAYNGTTVVQQMPFQSVLNSFKLMTSLSYQDLLTQGASLGFWPDDPLSVSFHGADLLSDPDGQGVCANKNSTLISPAAYGASTNFNSYNAFGANIGFKKRCSF